MDQQQAYAFLKMFFGDPIIADEGLSIMVMSLKPGRKTGRPGISFCASVEGAVDTAMRIAAGGDNAYFCLSLMDPRHIMKGRRGKADDSRGIVGFWADIDIANELAHQGKNPPLSRAEAAQILNACGVRPSVVVDSGHGLHAYWLFPKPWIFSDATERRQATDMAFAWHNTLIAAAHQLGRTLDPVFDLARVLRVPGTINTKIETDPKPVVLQWPVPARWDAPTRYTIEHMGAHTKAPEPGQVGEVIKPEKLEDVEFRAPNQNETETLLGRISLMCMSNARFSETWENKRTDMPSGELSASEYDLAIANALCEAGWNNQQIYWGMYLWRQKHSKDVDKLLKRPDYVARTIAAAKKSNVVAVATRELSQLNTEIDHLREQISTVDDPAKRDQIQTEIDSKREEVFQQASKALGVKISNFVKEGSGAAGIYYFELEDGSRVNLGQSAELWQQLRVKAAFYDHADAVMRSLDATQWAEVVETLTKYRENRTNHTVDPVYRWYSYLNEFVSQAETLPAMKSGPAPKDDHTREMRARLQHHLEMGDPFWEQNGSDDPVLYFSLEALKAYVHRTQNDRIHWDDISDVMHRMGCKRIRKAEPRGVSGAGRRIRRYLWAIHRSKLAQIDAELMQAYGKSATDDNS